MGYVFQVPINAIEEGGLCGCFNANVTTGAGDAEVILVVVLRLENKLKLWREVRHEALEYSFGRRCGGLGTSGGRWHGKADREERDRNELLQEHAHQCSEVSSCVVK